MTSSILAFRKLVTYYPYKIPKRKGNSAGIDLPLPKDMKFIPGQVARISLPLICVLRGGQFGLLAMRSTYCEEFSLRGGIIDSGKDIYEL